MNDEFSAFEEELESLRPRGPSPRLRAQLDAIVDPATGDQPRVAGALAPRVPAWWRRQGHFLAIAAGLAFALLIYLWQPFHDSTALDPEPGREVAQRPPASVLAAEEEAGEFRPVTARNSLQERLDEGLVTLGNGLSARRFRYQFVDTVVWENARSGARFEVSTPRDEIVLVPVHTF